MKKILLILSLITLNLSAYYGVVQFKNEYGFIMSYGWLQEVKSDQYEIYVASDEGMSVGNKRIYVKFNTGEPTKVEIAVITSNNEVKKYKTKRIENELEWYARIKIPFSCRQQCKLRITVDGEDMEDVNLYVR